VPNWHANLRTTRGGAGCGSPYHSLGGAAGSEATLDTTPWHYMHIVEERLLFFHAVGEALAQWAYVESQLWLLATLAFPLQQRQPVVDGLMAIESFRAKLRVCDRYIRHAFTDPDFVARWAKAREKLTRLSKQRNKVAHQVTVLYSASKEGRRFAMEDWNPGVLHPGEKPTSEALCLQQLELLRREFHQLTTDLASLNRLASIGVPLPPEFDVEHTRQRSLREIRALAMHGHKLVRLPVSSQTKSDDEAP